MNRFPAATVYARDFLRAYGDTVGLAALLALSLAVTLTVAPSWSWSHLAVALALMAVAALYLARPGLFICLALVPFAVLDEGTPDAVPGLRAIAEQLYSDRASGYIAPRDLLLALGVLAAANWFPSAPGRVERTFGRVTWVMIAAGGMVLASLVVGLYLLSRPAASLVALRPFYTCVATAYIVWRLLRWMTPERAERAVLGASLVIGGPLILLGAARIGGLAGTPVEISGVPITFYDAASPFVLVACVGIWAAVLAEHRAEGRMRAVLIVGVLAGTLVAIGSQRRAILLGYVAAAILLLVVNALRRRGGFGRSLKILFAVLGIAAVSLTLASVAVPGARELLVERVSSAFEAGEQRGSADEGLQFRVQESDAVYALAGRHTWDGIGPGVGFTPIDGTFLSVDGSYIHNTYLALPLRFGIWGMLALAALVLGLTLRVVRGLFRSPPMTAWILGAGILALLPAIATAGFFTQTVRFSIVVGAMIGAFDALSEPDDHETAALETWRA